jgi:hypothetical protein
MSDMRTILNIDENKLTSINHICRLNVAIVCFLMSIFGKIIQHLYKI